MTDTPGNMPLADCAPIPMVLHCPSCHAQHVDKAEEPPRLANGDVAHGCEMCDGDDECTCPGWKPWWWTNPPHRSHLCHACGCIWRPADVATVGVTAVETRGKVDTWPLAAAPEPKTEPVGDHAKLISEAANLIKPGDTEAVFYIRVGGEFTHLTTHAGKKANPEKLLSAAIEALKAEARDASRCPAHSANPEPKTEPCSMGVGCDEAGVCYAAAHGQPEQCPREPKTEPVGDMVEPIARIIAPYEAWDGFTGPPDGMQHLRDKRMNEAREKARQIIAALSRPIDQSVGDLVERLRTLALYWRKEGQYGEVAASVGDEVTAEYAKAANHTAAAVESAIAALSRPAITEERAILDWLGRNSIHNSAAAWLNDRLGPVFDQSGEPLDPMHIAIEVAQGVKAILSATRDGDFSGLMQDPDHGRS